MKNFYFYSLKILAVFFCLTVEFLSQEKYEVFVFKSNWHTGILIENNQHAKTSLRALKDFSQFNFVDIGWGDEDFYQRENFNPYYATKAIVTPTSSVIRFRGINTKENIIEESEFVIQFKLSESQFLNLLKFIDESFYYDENKNVIRKSARNSFSMVFYKSVLRYHLFYTCNTWVTEALKKTGFPVSTFMIITADDIFDEVSEVGNVLKQEKKKSKLFFK